ncbi:MAG: hypothetical protein OHK93_003517 [Ramalina farinacea]|uniref:PHD-type domain-containing protein n=1 Tax=Ramalina farinacea TaxID=258253 RepID=A0AA43QVE5_9LECA|nr:hypothetical protein [Ramalina farinacea]
MELMNDFLGINGNSTEETPRHPNLSRPSEAPQRTNATTEPPYWNNPYHSNATESQQTPANQITSSQFGVLELRNANPAPPASQAQNNPFWEAARSAVLNTVTTSQDLNPDTSKPTPTQSDGATPTQQPDDQTPTQTSMATPRGRGSSSRSRGSIRSGRRGISSSIRRPTIKIEPASEDSVPTLDNPATTIATDTPTPLTAAPATTTTTTTTISRGDRPRGSRAGNSAARAGRPVNRGGRPRGSRAGVSSASRVGVKRKRRRNLTDDEDDEGSDVSEKMALPMLSSSGRRITQTGQFGGMLGNGVGGGVIDLDAEEEEEEEEGEGGEDGARPNGVGAGVVGNHAPMAVRGGPGSRGGRGGRGGSYHHAALAAAAAAQGGNHATTTPTTTTDSGSAAGGGSSRGPKRKRLSLLGHHASSTGTKDSSALAAVCKNCGRGHSPSSNQIVFCDTCNTPWHQYCHDRPITPSVIIHEDKEWHCADCELLASITQITRGRISGAEMARLGGGGGTRTLKWKRDYLMGQGKEVLVGLLLGAELQSISRAPVDASPLAVGEDEDDAAAAAALLPPPAAASGGLRLFDPASTFATPAAVATVAATVNAIPHLESQAAEAQPVVLPVVAAEDDDTYEEPLPYPRTGNGLVLPAEEEDFDVLVDEGVGGPTFSHSWQEGGSGGGCLRIRGLLLLVLGMQQQQQSFQI